MENQDYIYVMSRIKTSMSGMSFEILPEEEKFFMTLIQRAPKPRKITLTRLADGAFNVGTLESYLGKVKLRGKRKYIQYIVRSSDAVVEYGETVDDLIPYIEKWFKKR